MDRNIATVDARNEKEYKKGYLPNSINLKVRVLPFFEDEQIPLLRILTDRGTEYKGKREHHEYELYLDIEGIEHSKTQVRHPQSNVFCERLHRSMQDEFYAVAFRKKLYGSLEQLQQDLDEWMHYYNHERRT